MVDSIRRRGGKRKERKRKRKGKRERKRKRKRERKEKKEQERKKERRREERKKERKRKKKKKTRKILFLLRNSNAPKPPKNFLLLSLFLSLFPPLLPFSLSCSLCSPSLFSPSLFSPSLSCCLWKSLFLSLFSLFENVFSFRETISLFSFLKLRN